MGAGIVDPNSVGEVIGPIAATAALFAGCFFIIFCLRRSHGRRATALKELVLRPPTIAQLRRSFAHKVQLLGKGDVLEEQDMKPAFVPASAEARPGNGARGRAGQSVDLDEDSTSSEEEADDVFRSQARPLGLVEELGTPEEYEENYGGDRMGTRHLELHGPIGETIGMLPSSDLRLNSILDSVTPTFLPGVDMSPRGDDGGIGYNYSRADATQPTEAAPARSMAALLRERYTKQRLERDQNATQPQELTPLDPAARAPDASLIEKRSLPGLPQPLHGYEEEESPEEPAVAAEGEDGMLVSLGESPRGLPRRPLPAPTVGGSRPGIAGDEALSPPMVAVSGVQLIESELPPLPQPLFQPSQPLQLCPATREPQTARQPSFAQRRAEARALTPRGTHGTGLQEPRGEEAAEADMAGTLRSERLPAPPLALPVRLGPQARRRPAGGGTDDSTEEAPSLPPANLRERRDLETALFRI